jgi:hypothetical protein
LIQILCASRNFQELIITETRGANFASYVCRRALTARAAKLGVEIGIREVGDVSVVDDARFVLSKTTIYFIRRARRVSNGALPKLNELFRVKRVRADETIKRAHPLIIMPLGVQHRRRDERDLWAT